MKLYRFLASDCTIPSDWIQRRMEYHKKGFRCVSGIVAPQNKYLPITASEYWVEYSNFITITAVTIVKDHIPHSLSYVKDIFYQFGEYREDLLAGEDTLFNKKIFEAGETIILDPKIVMYHRGSRTFAGFLRHQFVHGKELTKYLFADLKNKWHSFSTMRKILSLSLILIGKRFFLTYTRIFIYQKNIFLLSLIYSPLVFFGICSISCGAIVQFLLKNSECKIYEQTAS